MRTNDFYKLPNTPGLADVSGIYGVSQFKRNGIEHSYNPLDTARWQDVIFEKWSSMGVRYVNKPQQMAMFSAGSYPRVGEPYDGKLHFDWRGDLRRYHLEANGTFSKEPKWPRDVKIDWEFAGMQGRTFYYYEADTVNHLLQLMNKNRYHREEKMVLEFARPNSNTIILKGMDDRKDSLYIVLNKSDHQDPLLNKNK